MLGCKVGQSDTDGWSEGCDDGLVARLGANEDWLEGAIERSDEMKVGLMVL